MIKSDLKTGYIVTLRNGIELAVMLDTVFSFNDDNAILINYQIRHMFFLSEFKEDLTNKSYKSYDIMKIEKPNHSFSIQNLAYEKESRILIKERKE